MGADNKKFGFKDISDEWRRSHHVVTFQMWALTKLSASTWKLLLYLSQEMWAFSYTISHSPMQPMISKMQASSSLKYIKIWWIDESFLGKKHTYLHVTIIMLLGPS